MKEPSIIKSKEPLTPPAAPIAPPADPAIPAAADKTAEGNKIDAAKSQIPSANDAINHIIDDLIGQAPDPRPEIIAAETARKEGAAAAWKGRKDSAGILFDPNIHSFKDGTSEPAIKQDGSFRKKRANANERAAKQSKISTEGTQSQAIAPDDLACLQIGILMSRSSFGLMQAIGGNDFAPRAFKDPSTGAGTDEMELLQKSWIDYARAKNWRDLPPGVALTSTYLMILAPRLTMIIDQESKKTRLQLIMEKIKLAWKARQIRSQEKRRESENKDNHGGAA